jgi:hypothetical protein
MSKKVGRRNEEAEGGGLYSKFGDEADGVALIEFCCIGNGESDGIHDCGCCGIWMGGVDVLMFRFSCGGGGLRANSDSADDDVEANDDDDDDDCMDCGGRYKFELVLKFCIW